MKPSASSPACSEHPKDSEPTCGDAGHSMAAPAVHTAALPGELSAACMHVLSILMSPLAQGQRPSTKLTRGHLSELSRSCSVKEPAVTDQVAFIAMKRQIPLQETRLSQYHNYLNLEDIYDAHRETLQAECLHTVPVSPVFLPSACLHCAHACACIVG